MREKEREENRTEREATSVERRNETGWDEGDGTRRHETRKIKMGHR